MGARGPGTIGLLAAILAATACGGGGGDSATGSPPPAEGAVTVMSRNLYHGGDFALVSGGGPGGVPSGVDALWDMMLQTDVPARMRMVADELAAARPDLVGLQEVALWRTQRPGDGPATAATTVVYDLLELLLGELRARGVEYRAAAAFDGVDVELTGARLEDYRFTDRDVVLVRAGLATSNPRHGAFAARLPAPVPTPGGGVAEGVARGWASVDVPLGRGIFRFVTTHLETNAAVAAAQARELSAEVGADLPAILVGDLNAAPGDPAYAVLVAGPTGLRDAWAEAGAGPGPTCCHDPLVRDPTALPTRRIDHVLLRGGWRVRSAVVVGADPGAMRDGRWPSDHAGVVVSLDPP